MLSIAFSDREIRLVRGKVSGGKLRVKACAVERLEKGIIANGFVSDVAYVAGLLKKMLVRTKTRDREVIASISSNLIVFKELHLPQAKREHFVAMVNNEMAGTLSGEEYTVTFTVSGDVTANDVVLKRVAACACPRRLVDTYRQLFTAAGLRLKALDVSSSSISHLLLANRQYVQPTPLMLVQIDDDYINLSIFNNGHQSFVKYTKIDEEDYDGSEDYRVAAVADSVFRMLQFYRRFSLRQVVLLGSYGDAAPIQRALESMEITVEEPSLPLEGLVLTNSEAVPYAVALGGLLSAPRKGSHVDLLEAQHIRDRKRIDPFYWILGTAAVVSCAIIGGAYYSLTMSSTLLDTRIADAEVLLTDPARNAVVAEVNQSIAEARRLRDYQAQAEQISAALEAKPAFRSDVIRELEAVAAGEVTVLEMQQSRETVTVLLEATNQQAPSAYAQRLIDRWMFDAVSYTGYFTDDSGSSTFTLTLILKSGVTE